MCHRVEKSTAQSQFCAATEAPGRVWLMVEHSVGATGAWVMISVRAMISISPLASMPAPSASAMDRWEKKCREALKAESIPVLSSRPRLRPRSMWSAARTAKVSGRAWTAGTNGALISAPPQPGPGSVRTHERADADVDTEIMHVRGGFGKGGEEVEPVQAVESARPVQTLRDRIDAVVVGGGHAGADLVEALPVVLDELGPAIVESGEAESVGGQHGHVLRQLADLVQRAQIVAEAVRDRSAVEPDVRGEGRLHVVTGAQQIVVGTDERRMPVGVAGRPHGRDRALVHGQPHTIVEDVDRLRQSAHRLPVEARRPAPLSGSARVGLQALDLGPAVLGDSVGAGDVEVGVDAGAEVDGVGEEALDRA